MNATSPAAPARPAPFPHHYEVALEWQPGRPGVLRAGGIQAEGGAPAQFGGRDDWWSPEHLLTSALVLCLQTTYEALARRAALTVRAYASRAVGTLEKTAEGLRFTGFDVSVSVKVDAADVERARELLQSAKRHCIVSNALVAPVRLDAAVSSD